MFVGSPPVIAGAISKCSFSCQMDRAVSRKALPETVSSSRMCGKSTADSGSCKVFCGELEDIIDDAQNLLLAAICVPRCEILRDLRFIPDSVKSL